MEAKLINISIDQARTSLTSQFMVLQSNLNFPQLSGLFAEEPYEYLTLHKPKPVAELSTRNEVK